MTPLAASYRAALSTAARDALLRRRRPQSLPARTLLVHDHVIGEDIQLHHLATEQAVLRENLTAQLAWQHDVLLQCGLHLR